MARLPSLTSHRAARQRGLSLIELVVFIVVVAIGLTGILSVLTLTAEKSSDPMVRKQGIAVAEAMLEEVLLKNFADPPSGYTGGDRSQFDDVSDYHNFNLTPVASLADPGIPIAGLGTYAVNVTVVTEAFFGIASAKKITVTVTSPSETFALIGYRTDY
jgi:MSHA pilin protein MshD